MHHHYLPQFYLRQWVGDDGKLWRCRREPSGVVSEKAVAPRATAFEPDLYAIRDATGIDVYDPHIIETEFFSGIDSDAALVHQKLLGPLPVRLSDEDRHAWALFLMSLLERTPARLGPLDHAAPAIAEQVNAHLRAACVTPESRAYLDEILADLDTVQMARNAIREFMVKEIRNAAAVDALKSLTWLVVPRETTTPLLTTDCPLHWNKRKPFTNGVREGIARETRSW
jgi:hypothetical protein